MTQPHGTNAGQSGNAPEATVISVILDRSGSMASMRGPTIKGFNEFMHGQRDQKDGGRALVSLTQFDDEYEVNFVGEPIENLPELDTDSYVPRGSTALYDAIGRTVHEMEGWAREHDWKERVLVVIITDGLENSSQEFDLPAIQALIERKEKDGWNFVYMGANQDSFAVGGAMKIRRDHSANWDATPDGMASAYSRVSHSAREYRGRSAKGIHAQAFFADSPDEPPKKEPAGKLTPMGPTKKSDK